MRRRGDGTHACSRVSQDGNPSTLRPRGCHPLYSLASGLDTGEHHRMPTTQASQAAAPAHMIPAL